jgi:hypothetical protein
MIYTFGSSLTKYYWPTWADWLNVYQGPVTNLAFPGYDCSKVYWSLLDNVKNINSDDQVYIMWPGNTTTTVWYDREWVEKNNCHGFFPNPQGDLWYTQDVAWMGLYKQHPDHLTSFTHLLIQNIQCMLYSQILLEKTGCKYTMLFNLNPWIDIRPVYGEKYTMIWDKILNISDDTVKEAKNIIDMSPVKYLMSLINWDNVIEVPTNLQSLEKYKGLWEYDILNKEYVTMKNNNDMHPSSLAHHDYLLEKILKQDPKEGIYRNQALDISNRCMNTIMPTFEVKDFTATPDTHILQFGIKLPD